MAILNLNFPVVPILLETVTVQLRTVMQIRQLETEIPKSSIISNGSGYNMFVLDFENVQNSKNDTFLLSLKNIKIVAKLQKNLKASFVGRFWTIQKITPKSALLSYYYIITVQFQT